MRCVRSFHRGFSPVFHSTSTIMPWPPTILNTFPDASTQPSGGDYHGPYTKLLSSLFPPGSGFSIGPQRLPANQTLNSVLMFKVTLGGKPVLVLELQQPIGRQFSSTSEAANNQFRSPLKELAGWSWVVFDRLGELTVSFLAQCPLPVLHAVKAMGTSLCFHRVRNGTIKPRKIRASPINVADTVPLEHRNYNILEDEGEQAFRRLVDKIKQECEAL